MKIIIFLVSLLSLLTSMNIFADDRCAYYAPDYDTPTCQTVIQLKRLDSKLDDINRKLNDIESKLEEIQPKIDHK